MKRLPTILLAILAATVGLGIAFGANELSDLQQQVDASKADRADLRDQNAEQSSDLDRYGHLLREVNRRCKEADDCQPVPVPAYTPGEPGQPGSPGSPGVAGVDGQDGRDGDPGQPGVPGESGADGHDGAPGESGPQGEPGPPGTQGPQGATGSDGKDGAPGKDGRGIQTLTCTDTGRWTVSYSDGTTEDAGPCRATELPPPSE